MTAVQPVTYSLVSPDELLAALGLTYDIAAAASCHLLRSGMHDTYVIVSRHERYVVRVYRSASRSLEEVSYELDLLSHLAAKSVAVSAPVPDREGRTMQLLPAPEGCRPVAVFSYAGGTRLSWDAHQSRLAGALLADIHRASDDFVARHARTAGDLASLVDRPLAAIGPLLERRPDDSAFLRDFAAMVRAQLEAVAGELEWGVCHGDFGAKNMHIDAAGHVTAFDFDRCGPGWRAADFALVRWAATGRKKPETWDAFVDGYRGVRTLPVADLEIVPLFHALALLATVGHLATYADTWGTARVRGDALDGWLAALRTSAAEQTQSMRRQKSTRGCTV